jgi:hypothetical protein
MTAAGTKRTYCSRALISAHRVKALGLAVPPSLLARADEVIE